MWYYLQAAFKKVDYTYVLNAAQLMKAGGVQHFSLLTSKGANQKSWFLYPKTKGLVCVCVCVHVCVCIFSEHKSTLRECVCI